MSEYDYSSYGGRVQARWPTSRKGMGADAYERTKASLIESIKKARLSLLKEKAGGRRRTLERSIERAKKLLKELEEVQ